MEATIPQSAAGAGLIGLPSERATPSTPTSGELVLSFMAGHGMGDNERFNAFLYADGRLIWTRSSHRSDTGRHRATPHARRCRA